MLLILKENIQFVFILLLWVLTGVFAGSIVYLLIPLSIFLYIRKKNYFEVFIGFWFILILSDSLEYQLGFAKNIKNIYIVLLAGFLLLNRKDFLPLSHFYQRFLPFFLIAIIAMAYSETILITIQKTISYILIFIIVPNYFIKNYRDLGDEFFKKLAFFIIAILLISLALKYILPEVGISHGERYRGIFGNPNGIAIFCVLSFLLIYLIEHFRPGLFTKGERIFIYGLLLGSVYMSGSRNAAVAITMFLLYSRFFRMSPFLGFIVFLFSVFLYELIGGNYVTIIKYLGLESYFRLKTLEVGGGRYIAWNFAWEQIQYNFFIGKGIAFDEFIMRKNYHILSRLGHEGGVHNSYLILWLNTGIIGLLAYFRSFILSFIQGNKITTLAYPVMFTIMFTIAFEPWIVSSLNPFTIIFLMIITMLTDATFHKKEEEVVLINDE